MAKMNHIFGRKFKIFNHSVFVVSTNCCSQKRVKNKVRFFVYNSVSFSPTDKIWISLKPLWNFWSNELIRSPKFEKKYERAQAFLTIFFLKRAPPNKGKLQKKDAICCQKCIILEQSKWSHAGCLNTANLATSQAELASEASFCLSFLINSWLWQIPQAWKNIYPIDFYNKPSIVGERCVQWMCLLNRTRAISNWIEAEFRNLPLSFIYYLFASHD